MMIARLGFVIGAESERSDARGRERAEWVSLARNDGRAGGVPVLEDLEHVAPLLVA
jgi:hypothetical protein